MKNTINTSKIEQAIRHLIKVVDAELEKGNPQAYDKLIDTLVEKMGDEIYQSKAGDIMDTIHELSEPDYKKKYLKLSSALYHAKDDAVFRLVHLTDSALSLHKLLHEDSPDELIIKAEANQLKRFADEVQVAVRCELYERVQGYRSDIEKLIEVKS